MKTHIAKALLILFLLTFMLSGCQNAASVDGGEVTVEAVEEIVGPAVGLYDRYSGVVVSQSIIEVKKDDSKVVKEVYVNVGDVVKPGDKLFSYDVDEIDISIRQTELEIEQQKNSVSSMQEQIEELKEQSEYADSSEQLEYTLQINKLENDIREAETIQKQKSVELDKLKNSAENVDVFSECEGRIQSINETGADEMGNPAPFISIMELGAFRVKGTVNEMNASLLFEGMPVIIRSRVDENVVLSGSVESIDLENPIQDNNMYYVEAGSEMTTASKYSFYILLDSTDGLIMGQHVYIEPDMGQSEVKEGLYLPSYYIASLESNPFVWAANKHDKLEKRTLTLGEYDENTDTWQIVGGLELSDYIAFPDESLEEGMTVSYYDPYSEDIPSDEKGPAMEGAVDVPLAVAVEE